MKKGVNCLNMKKNEIVSFILECCIFCEDKAEAESCLCEILDINKSQLFLINDICDVKFEKVQEVVERLNKGEPIAKILHRANFYGRNFYVDENVLTPRQDSEVLVYLADKVIKEKMRNKNNCEIKVLDLCCGSGCLGLTLKALNETIDLCLVDISEKALNVAKINAKNMEIVAKIEQSNMFEKISGKFDIIISNPPYIKTSDVALLEKQVKEFDPIIALDGDADGLRFYREIAENANKHLTENGVLLCEFGYDQAEEVKKIFDKKFLNVKIYKDNGGNDRVVVCKDLIRN